MDLHVYSPVAGCPSVDAACLAAVWLAERSLPVQAVYASGNPHMSPTGSLPAIVSSSAEAGTDKAGPSTNQAIVSVAGFAEIAALLEPRPLKPLEVALLAYCQELAVHTHWTLFLVNENYEGLTRPEISAAIPFPMQYNAALALRRRAEAFQPRTKGRSKAGDAQPVREVSSKETEVTKLHAAMLEKARERENARQAPKDTMRRLVQITDLLATITPLLDEISEDSPVLLLVAANLVLLTLPQLASRPLASPIEGNDRLRALRDLGRALNIQLSKVVRPVPPEHAYTLWNTVASYVR